MRRISLNFIGMSFLAAAALYGQSSGPVYWSTTQPDCSSLGENPVAITNSSGATIGYSCYASGTFIWFAAGGGWGSAIRVAAPASAPVGVNYTFYDTSGNPMSLDTSGAATGSNKEVSFALTANQPAELDLLGATGNGPNYGNLTIGSMYAIFYCPDANTCGSVTPQLIYSNLPSNPWALSVPISWDGNEWTQWSAEGIDDNAAHRVSFVVYNQGTTAATYKVSVYDSSGKLAGSGTTPSIPPLQNSGNGEAGTYGAQLRQIISNLPSGTFKVLFDGGTLNSFVQVLQFYGPSATTLQVAPDSAPTASTTAMTRSMAANLRPNLKQMRVESSPKGVFGALPK